MLILISAGHSTVAPRDSGAVGNGYQEANIALEMRDRVARILRINGCSVITDGADGINEPLAKAITLARRADIAVEFHLNASVNPQSNGVECLSLPKNKSMSQKIAKAISAVTGAKLRGANEGWINQNAGAHHRLGFCMAGGIIVEFCFISNRDELQKFLSKKEEVAASVAACIMNKIPVTKADAGAEFYIVANGDTLYAISRKFNVTVSEIQKINNLKNALISPGQKLILKM